MRKGHPKMPHGEKTQEIGNFQLEAASPAPDKKARITLTYLCNRSSELKMDQRGQKEDENALHEKDRVIKELQESIIRKKEKNDRIQEAFTARQEAVALSQNQENKLHQLKVIIQGCATLASKHRLFRKAMLKNLVQALRQYKTSPSKGAKLVLIWLVGWINHLFNFLFRSLADSPALD